MHHQGVALADVIKQRVELGTLGVLAGGLVGEHLVHLGAFQLPIRVLVKGADPDVADPLSVHDASKGNVYE
ncbi:hypothetical protein D3C81_1969680 [compost metagenome]